MKTKHIPDSEATVAQIKSWDRDNSINWTSFVLGAMFLGIVAAMISYDVTPFLEANDVFLTCK